MAIPKCPHCNATRFQLTENEPMDANYKIFILHCVGCGAPAGAMEYIVPSVLIAQQEKKLLNIQERWSRLTGQNGGLAKVDSGFDYAANFSSVACVA